MSWVAILLLVLAVALVAWIAAAVLVRRNRPPREIAVPAVQILPDIVELARRIGVEPGVPRRLRLGLWGVRAWLASPIDLIPDFLPAVGQLDDLIVALAVLRRVMPRVEAARRLELWPGTPEGLVLFERLLAGERSG
jgi:uncharacterized membrane protein YkvA (DUF1232 family)